MSRALLSFVIESIVISFGVDDLSGTFILLTSGIDRRQHKANGNSNIQSDTMRTMPRPTQRPSSVDEKRRETKDMIECNDDVMSLWRTNIQSNDIQNLEQRKTAEFIGDRTITYLDKEPET